jgi:hypothetical protein
MNITEYVAARYKNFKMMEDREIMVHHISEAFSFGDFIIRSLANPECDGSKEAVDAIVAHRERGNQCPTSTSSTR